MTNVIFYKLNQCGAYYSLTKFDTSKYQMKNHTELHTSFTKDTLTQINSKKSNNHTMIHDKVSNSDHNQTMIHDKVSNSDHDLTNNYVTTTNKKLSVIKRFSLICNFMDNYIKYIPHKFKLRLFNKLKKLSRSGLHIYFSFIKNKLNLYLNKNKFSNGAYILLSLLKHTININKLSYKIKASILKFHNLLHKF